ncbi:MAG TPA: hypothetical protein VGO40_05580 [Longimicrobium sp.]|jgi:hypothetical protein|nr:hypothetical protein [Longimicrobium sp.]
MTWTIMGTYDGSKLIPDEPLPLEPGTRVLLTVHVATEQHSSDSPHGTSFIETALSMNVDGPSDWSARIDHSLYGPMVGDDDEL